MTALASDLVVRSLAVTFRSGTTIAEHRHRWGQLVVVARGAMRVTAVSQVWITPPTRALWLPAGVPHRLCAVGAEVALRTLYLAEPLSQALPAQPSVREVSPLLRELVLHILSLGMLAGSQPAQARLAPTPGSSGYMEPLTETVGRCGPHGPSCEGAATTEVRS